MSISEELAVIRMMLQDIPQRTGPEYHRSPEASKDIHQFYALVEAAWRDWQLLCGKAESRLVKFTEDWPPEPWPQDEVAVVSVRLMRREPAVMGKTAPFTGQPRELKPRVREVRPDENVPGYQIYELGWMMDNMVQFTIWSQSNKEANKLSMDWEDFMNQTMWFYRSQGVNQLFFNARDEDFQIYEKRLVGRALEYYVRTEKITHVQEKVLEELAVNITVEFDSEEDSHPLLVIR